MHVLDSKASLVAAAGQGGLEPVQLPEGTLQAVTALGQNSRNPLHLTLTVQTASGIEYELESGATGRGPKQGVAWQGSLVLPPSSKLVINALNPNVASRTVDVAFQVVQP